MYIITTEYINYTDHWCKYCSCFTLNLHNGYHL